MGQSLVSSEMVSRKVPKEVLQIFDKYVINNVRNLSKDKSIEMLQNEFQLTTEQAEQMFETFDQDQNGKMSVWEFQQFYACVGANAQAWVQRFIELDVDKSGHLDMEEARAGMSEFKTESGHEMSPKEIEFFLKNAADEKGLIDLGKFVGLLSRLKVYKGQAGRK